MENRFEPVRIERLSFGADWRMEVYVLKDKHTGVLYLAERMHNSGGLTPLLDEDGKPVRDL